MGALFSKTVKNVNPQTQSPRPVSPLKTPTSRRAASPRTVSVRLTRSPRRRPKSYVEYLKSYAPRTPSDMEEALLLKELGDSPVVNLADSPVRGKISEVTRKRMRSQGRKVPTPPSSPKTPRWSIKTRPTPRPETSKRTSMSRPKPSSYVQSFLKNKRTPSPTQTRKRSPNTKAREISRRRAFK
jgi:hypothetical protein